ncbi:hypothetical protein CKA32_002934 [Geitlerinema sp. FC II]|nr:hypothetical protein [Geitlerinema sp. CS-897]PPT10280.1 hypothetical protein CKA32_002934 [Geitlerinema sp. FC II]
MTQAQALQLAKRGNPTAIAAIMNHQLQWQHVRVTASRQEYCLQVEISAKGSLPDRTILMQWVRVGLMQLNPKAISQVCVSGKQNGTSKPLWKEEFELPSVFGDANAIAALETRVKALIPSSVWEKAKGGDSEALSQLLDVAVWQNDARVTAAVEERQLQVTVDAEALPDEAVTVTSIVMVLQGLDIPWLTSAVVLGRSRRNALAVWKRVLDAELDPRDKMRHSIASIVNFYERSVNPRILERSVTQM